VRILVIEDEVDLAESLREGLVAEGFDVTVALDGITGRDLAIDGSFDAVVLDIMLPRLNGYRVCAELRAAKCDTPILMLTAKDGEFDEAEGLDTGADDFLAKPFSFVVLLARLRAITRRGRAAGTISEGRQQCGDLVIDRGQRRVWRGRDEVMLTSREFDVLSELVRATPDVVAKGDLLTKVWGPRFEGDPNVVEVYVGYVRRKIDVPSGHASIQTVRGHGYRFVSS
jgi:two-component system, OmpR family, response regulator